MTNRPRPWWMYGVIAIYVLAFFFNARQEALGPAGTGWTPAWPTLNVISVAPGSPMEDAGLRTGDVLEAVNAQPLTGMVDWFLARAHFERDHRMALQIRRGDRHLTFFFVISAPAWRTWKRAHTLGVIGYYFARSVLLSLAIVIAFKRPQQLSARFAALMFAIGAVAEGYPSSGWAASLYHLPALLAIPIYLEVASCLLSPLVLLCFVASFPRPRPWARWQLVLVLLPAAILAISIVRSGIAMIYTPVLLVRPWPIVLSSPPLRILPTTAGVTPLLFVNLFPLLHSTATQTRLLELWLAFSIVCFAAALFLLFAKYLRAKDEDEQRQIRAAAFALLIFVVLIVHNLLARNWMIWFGTGPPTLFSAAGSGADDVLFLLVPLTLFYCVLKQSPDRSVHGAAGTYRE